MDVIDCAVDGSLSLSVQCTKEIEKRLIVEINDELWMVKKSFGKKYQIL